MCAHLGAISASRVVDQCLVFKGSSQKSTALGDSVRGRVAVPMRGSPTHS